MKKKVIPVLIIGIIIFQMLMPLQIKADNAWDISKNGDGSITATLDTNGKLTISGKGEMKDWDFSRQNYTPWDSLRDTIKTVEIQSGVTSVGDNAFMYCRKLNNIIIPNSVTSIGSVAFCDCSSLANITIPNSVTSIGDSAFCRCSSLTNINIPNRVTSIGDGAFAGCYSLTNIIIPNSVIRIGEAILANCSKLTNIQVEENNINYVSNNGVLYHKTNNKEDYLIQYPAVKKDTEYAIIEGITKIGDFAFDGCSSLININIPNSVTSIGDFAFDGCRNLTNISIPNSVTSIGHHAFYSCSSLINISIPNSVTSIEDCAFYGCSSLTNISIPNSVTSIGGCAFNFCSNLTNITIPNSVTIIGDEAFGACSSLANITIPNSVTSIGDSAFSSCSSLTNISIPNSVTSIGDSAFYFCSNLTNISIPNSVIRIGDGMLASCKSLTNIQIEENNVNYVSNNGVLYHKTNNKEDYLIQYPARKKDTEYAIIEGITKIGDSAFYCCSSLINISIPNSVTSIGDDAFWGCGSLTNITIPSSVTSIGHSAFCGCSNLTNISIANSVTSIGYQAFSACSNLTNITIPNSVTSIGDDAFWGCSSLTNISIPNSVTSIGDSAFDSCYSLTSVSIPNSVTSIGDSAFDDCYSLTSIICKTGSTAETYAKTNNIKYTIDDLAPELAIKYSITNITNQNVIATITANEPLQVLNGWTLSVDKKTLSKEYSANVTENITTQDLVGNEKTVQIKIGNIDKTAPIAKISYSTTNITNQNVIATITANEAIQAVSGWNLSTDKKTLTKEYLNNASENIIIKDLAGNAIANPIAVEINNIDKTAPTAKISYSTTNITNQNVIATITANEAIQAINDWTLSADKKSLSKEYSENAKENVTIKDLAGNAIVNPIAVEINSIDKTAPTAKISYSTTNITNQKIIATITSNEAIQAVSGWNLSTDKKTLTKEYLNNASENIIIKDLAGNAIANPIAVAIKNIDKTAPTVELTAKGETGITIKATDDLSGIIGYAISTTNTMPTTFENVTNTKTLEKEITSLQKDTVYYIWIKDAANNISSIKQVKTNEHLKNTISKYREETDSNINYIRNIQLTTIEEILTNIVTNGTVKIYKGTEEITDKNTKVFTGMIIDTKLNGEEEKYTCVVRGDINGDGVVDIKDMFALNKHRLNKTNLTGAYLKASDVTDDAKEDIQDMFKLNKYRLNKINSL